MAAQDGRTYRVQAIADAFPYAIAAATRKARAATTLWSSPRILAMGAPSPSAWRSRGAISSPGRVLLAGGRHGGQGAGRSPRFLSVNASGRQSEERIRRLATVFNDTLCACHVLPRENSAPPLGAPGCFFFFPKTR